MFKSSFSKEIEEYLIKLEQSGYSIRHIKSSLKRFDSFCYENAIVGITFTEEMAEKLLLSKPKHLKQQTHYSYICVVRRFINHLISKDYKLYPPNLPTYAGPRHVSYVYSEDEIRRYFRAVDLYDYSKYPLYGLSFPLLMRLLYCCGLRINEALSIKKKDVDLIKGTILLEHTKGGGSRIIKLNDKLLNILIVYANKIFYRLHLNEYIFIGKRNLAIAEKTVREWHLRFLFAAYIPNIGRYRGPRLHDFRHTFAVRSLKQMIDSGMDSYAAMPILAAYMGHDSIEATQYYLKITLEHYPYLEERIGSKLALLLRDL